MAIMARSRTNAPASLVQQQQQPVTQPQKQQQQQQPPRQRRHSLTAGVFWKLGVPLILLLSVFTILDQVGRDIEELYSTSSVSTSKQGDTDTDANAITSDSIKRRNKNKKSKRNDNSPQLAFGTGSTATNEDRIAERRKKRDQKRSDLVHDKRRKRQSSSDWLRSDHSSLSGSGSSAARRHTMTTPKKTSVVLFDYNQPAVRSNATTTTTLNEPTADYSTAKTIVFVMSARQHFERRAMIRQTWGKDHAVYFVTGGQPASEQHKATNMQGRLLQEQATHQDLIDSIHPESYRGLPHKLKFAYQWILPRWPDVQWLVKVDDDTVVRIDTLQHVVLDTLNPAHPIVAGRIKVDAPVRKTGKWAELLYTESETYPYWPQGSCGHAVSRPVAEYVAQKATAGELTLYQGEDTSLGIWLHEASLKKELHVTWFKSQYFTNNGYCHSREWLIIGHRISPAQMKACYDKSDEWTEEYRLSAGKNLWQMNNEEQNERAS
jgi:hypothetical protein